MDTLVDTAHCLGPIIMWDTGTGASIGECGTCGTVFVGGRDDFHRDTPNVTAE